MNKKTYRLCRLSIIIVLSMSISVSITLNNYYLPIIFMLTAASALYYCRKHFRPKGAVADERDYQSAGKASRYTITIFSWLGALLTFVLMAVSQKQGELYILSQYLAYTVCFLMLLNSALYKYFNKKG